MSREQRELEERTKSTAVLREFGAYGHDDTLFIQRIEPHQMAEEIVQLRAQLAAAEEEGKASSALIARQSALLTGVVNAIRGEPAPLSMYSHHDAVELVLALRTRAERAEAKIEAALNICKHSTGLIAQAVERALSSTP